MEEAGVVLQVQAAELRYRPLAQWVLVPPRLPMIPNNMRPRWPTTMNEDKGGRGQSGVSGQEADEEADAEEAGDGGGRAARQVGGGRQ